MLRFVLRRIHRCPLLVIGIAREDEVHPAHPMRTLLADVARSVAAFLHNTPAITRKSYIAPCLFAMFENAKLADLWAAAPERHDGLRVREVKLAIALEAAS